MGTVISYFRKKKSTTEVLEKLEQDIKRLNLFRAKNQERQKKFIAKLLLYSIVLYVVGAVVFYFYYFPEKWKERLLYSIPLLLFPLVIWLVKKVLHWYFVKRIAENDMELQDLREKRTKILEEVMEKETYKKAKEILEKFDPARYKELEAPKPAVAATPGSELRQRQVMQRSPPGTQPRPGLTPGMRMGTPMRAPMTGARPGMTPMRAPMTGARPGMTPFGPRGSGPGPGIRPRNILDASYANGTPHGPPLPRAVLPRERGPMDRVLEYLVGDGPQNRFALICRECVSHNGMALKEEFEYIAFRCCYCYALNPPRKRRPYAPRIEPQIPLPRIDTNSQDEDESGSDDEEDDDDDNDNNDDENGGGGEEEGSREGDDNEKNEILEDNNVCLATTTAAAGNQPDTVLETAAAAGAGDQGQEGGGDKQEEEGPGEVMEVEEAMEVEQGSEVVGQVVEGQTVEGQKAGEGSEVES